MSSFNCAGIPACHPPSGSNLIGKGVPFPSHGTIASLSFYPTWRAASDFGEMQL